MENNSEFLEKNGYLILENFVSEDNLNKIKKGFEEHTKYIRDLGLEGISGPEKNIANEKILNYCPGILDIVNNKSLNHLLEKYLGKNFKILNIYPTISKPIKADANDQRNFNKDESLCCYHHDQIGKQLKLIIVLHDIDENQNCLEYAVQSHKVGILDQYIIKFFNFFGFFKNWDKSIINHLFLKILGRNPAFLKEKTISKKFKIKQVYAKSGAVFMFDTNGYHRQKPANEFTDFNILRKTIFLDCAPEKQLARSKIRMKFETINKDLYQKMGNYFR